jgi:hypothetical protein
VKKNTKSARKILTESLPAPTAGTEWKFRMVIRYGDVIGVQSNAMEKEENRMVKQKGEK